MISRGNVDLGLMALIFAIAGVVAYYKGRSRTAKCLRYTSACLIILGLLIEPALITLMYYLVYQDATNAIDDLVDTADHLALLGQ